MNSMIDQYIENLWQYKIRFTVVFFLVFTVLYGTLFALDFLPEPPTQSVAVESEPAETLPVAPDATLGIEIVDEVVTEPSAEPEPAEPTYELPTEIYFEALDKTVEVLNPTSNKIADLDRALLSGTVRHPDSAFLNQDGNVFILGHSSYLPNVFNEHFQAFNGIQNLKWGDIITVTGETRVYTYRVESVYEAKASELFVPIADVGQRLTLATCDSFGSIDDRFIVEAELVDSSPIDA